MFIYMVIYHVDIHSIVYKGKGAGVWMGERSMGKWCSLHTISTCLRKSKSQSQPICWKTLQAVSSRGLRSRSAAAAAASDPSPGEPGSERDPGFSDGVSLAPVTLSSCDELARVGVGAGSTPALMLCRRRLGRIGRKIRFLGVFYGIRLVTSDADGNNG